MSRNTKGNGSGSAQSGEAKPLGRRFEELFYGAATVGERGQIVIPARARRDFDIETGDKLLILGRARKSGLMLCKIDALRELATEYMEGLRLAEMHAADDSELEDEGEVAK